jgi:CHAT domain-containing protein/tetratricopeptide (TPR) repeat protein
MNNPATNHDRFRATARDSWRAVPPKRCGYSSIIHGFLRVRVSTLASLAFLVLSGIFFPSPTQAYEKPGVVDASPDASSTPWLDRSPTPQEDAKALDAGIQNAADLLSDAQTLIEAGNLDQGESKVHEAFATYDRLPNTNALVIFGHANCYLLLGEVAQKRGDPQKAFKSWQQAVPLYERLSGPRAAANLAETLKRMGGLLLAAGQTEDALTVFQKIDEIQEGADSAVRANTKSNIGELLRRLGRPREAEEQLQQAVTLSETGHSTAADKARYLFNLGLTEHELHSTKPAIEHYKQSLRLMEGLQNNEESRGKTLAALGQALGEEGDRDEALKQLTAALEAIKDRPDLRELKAKTLNERALAIPDNTPAQRTARVKDMREALSLVEGLEGTEETQVICAANLAEGLRKMGNLEGAIGIYKEVLAELSKKPFQPTNSQLEDLYNNLGIYLMDSGRASEALDSLLQSLNHAWLGMVDQLPSMTQKETLSEATIVARRANFIYSIALSSPKTMAPRAYEALLRTKALYSEANRARLQQLFHANAPNASSARERYVELRRRISRRTLDSDHSEVAVSSKVLTQMAAEADRLEHDLLGASRQLPGDLDLKPVHASQVLSQLRPGEVLIDYFTYASLDLKTRKELGRRYGAFVVHAGGSIEAIDLGEAAAVVSAVEAFRDCESGQISNAALNEDELAKFGESVRRLILDPALPSLDSLRRIYVAPDGVLGLFPFDALPLAKGPAGWRYLAEDVEVVHLLSGLELTRATASRSRNTEVWLLGDPDFDATPSQRIAAFNDRSRLGNVPLASKGGSGAKQGAVLMGSPLDSDDASSAVPANWQRMNDTRLIVNSAAEQAAKAGLKTTVLLGVDASEENLSRVSSARLLMFATHGYFMKKMPAVHAEGSIHFDSRSDSLTMVSRDEVKPGETVNGIIYDNQDLWQTMDPLQRSMMVLAGANHRVHHVVDYLVNGQLLSPDETSKQKPVGQELEREISDGLLTAYKVVGMNLTGTDLVVLAGCESGLGVSVDSKLGTGIKQESESVVGLRQAFTMAGARSVVTSMWDVPLDATVQQISAFLNAWLSHEHPRYQAFHESQLNVLHAARNNKQGGHPFWWAGFIYFGDPGDR